jgi:hypothetical protein
VAVGTECPNEVLVKLLEAARRCLPALRGVDKAQLARLSQLGALGDLADGVAACLGYATDMQFRQKLLETQGPVDRAEMLLSWFDG